MQFIFIFFTCFFLLFLQQQAEERAHEAEHGLKETKDLLKAATEVFM